FTTKDQQIALQFPSNWYENKGEHQFDLQCFSEDDRMMTGVFQFQRIDLAKATTPHDILDEQVADMRSKRKNFQLIEGKKVVRDGERTLTTVVYSGEKDLANNYYRFTLIEFSTNPGIFAVVLQTAIPSEWAKNKVFFDAINRSATLGPSARAGAKG
ncbi:MAG TPA: hypothetical protein VFC86_02425, partial [Planctomycetota bacterium]|nr:hypothetical protein [Planctomycetota bacterium]